MTLGGYVCVVETAHWDMQEKTKSDDPRRHSRVIAFIIATIINMWLRFGYHHVLVWVRMSMLVMPVRLHTWWWYQYVFSEKQAFEALDDFFWLAGQMVFLSSGTFFCFCFGNNRLSEQWHGIVKMWDKIQFKTNLILNYNCLCLGI